MGASCASLGAEPRGRAGSARVPPAALGLAVAFAFALGAPARAAQESAERGAELAIGLLVSRADALGESRIHGAQLALDEANARGAHADRKFRLRLGQVENPWLTSANAARELVHDAHCVALIAPPERDIAHLAAQVASRGRTPLVVLASDSSLTRVPSPWILRVVPDDRAQIRALVAALPEQPARVTAFVPEGRAGSSIRADLAWLSGELGVRFDPLLEVAPAAVAQALQGATDRAGEPVLVWLPQAEPSALLSALEASAWRGAVLLPREILEGGVVAAAGDAQARGRAVRLNAGAPESARFEAAFVHAWGDRPDAAAAAAYDAATLCVRAIDAVGADPDALRVWFSELREHRGATGQLRFDASGNRVGDWTVERFELGAARAPESDRKRAGSPPRARSEGLLQGEERSLPLQPYPLTERPRSAVLP